jgi:hypothetical protein
MNKEQATIIIVLLAAILFVLLVGRTAAVELLGSLFWVAVVIFAVAAVGLLVRETFRSFHARAQEKLDDEIKLLCEEISTYPGPQLTAEHIPQRFPSKEAAQAFGERWSRGGPDSFSARAVDVNNRSDDLPGFDKTSISGGIETVAYGLSRSPEKRSCPISFSTDHPSQHSGRGDTAPAVGSEYPD